MKLNIELLFYTSNKIFIRIYFRFIKDFYLNNLLINKNSSFLLFV